jgi:hypothetical protein
MNSGKHALQAIQAIALALAGVTAAMFFAVSGPAWSQDKSAPDPKKAAAPALADSAKDQGEKSAVVPAATSTPPPVSTASKLNYLPPGKGVPIRREGGATRGGDQRELALSVVTPEHVGWSSREQPDLYWFVSRPVTSSVVLTIAQIGGTALDPLFEGALPAPATPGIHAISLKDLKVTLTANQDYEWSISLVGDPQARSRDILASGRIRWVPLPADLRAALASATADQRTEKLANSGYWYDVVDLLRKGAPASTTEIALYESAGLSRIARFLREGI